MFLDDVPKLLVLGVIALVVFGPDRLPTMAAQAGRLLRELRRMAEGARSELQENLPAEFSEFDFTELSPKRFVRKHLLDELSGDGVLLGRTGQSGNGAAQGTGNGVGAGTVPMARLAPGEMPPYDAEAT